MRPWTFDYHIQEYLADHIVGGTQDKLGWKRVHVVGHSMGAMIACKLAARAPELIVSLTLISVTGGGWQSVPRSFKALKLAVLVSPPDAPALHHCNHSDGYSLAYCTTVAFMLVSMTGRVLCPPSSPPPRPALGPEKTQCRPLLRKGPLVAALLCSSK